MLDDYTTAPIGEPVRATLGLLKKVSLERDALGASDMRAVLDAGVTREQIEHALSVAWAFNVITRLADTFEFWVGPPASFASSAKMLLTRGYKL